MVNVLKHTNCIILHLVVLNPVRIKGYATWAACTALFGCRSRVHVDRILKKVGGPGAQLPESQFAMNSLRERKKKPLGWCSRLIFCRWKTRMVTVTKTQNDTDFVRYIILYIVYMIYTNILYTHCLYFIRFVDVRIWITDDWCGFPSSI